ncbi:flavin reductase family protein [Halapricum desulfuricans]|uniref:NADH-FMN oxidoreductase RutF, flavin reductase (DIM6/NTAB) family n=1 Tax=Halapricum desulfuricans TaxID=2841257 RepID=A0A897MYK1_9EURY|nr:flavin reductase family protein [Halapricum desulfuricans]QSG05068.1 NADH-FMN oxidoreductase RutF, flavin reductase (DIM6/NTAB) family [Halapricum desulfuricans]
MTADPFEEISPHDSKSLFKPKVVSLVVTDSPETGPNVMTASWWMLAGYNPLRYQLAVSHKTHTHEIIEESGEFVLAAPSTGMIDALAVAGQVSGRDVDKIEYLDLDTVPGKHVDVPLLADAVGNIECSVIDSFTFENCTYYFADVETAHVTRGGLDGRVLSLDDADVLAYMGSDWDEGDEGTKSRYYLDLSDDDVRRYPGDAVHEALPDTENSE